MKQILLAFTFLILAVVANIYVNNGSPLTFGIFKSQPTAVIDNHSFSLLLAKTAKERELGLSIKNSLPQNTGMLFIFDKPDYYSFWMKDMKFPIDIIFIQNGKIVTIFKNVPPPTPNKQLPIEKPKETADRVLEINAGLSDAYHFKTGDNVNISL